MNLSFFKYQGSGNDFILIDDRSQFFPTENQKAIRLLCSRHWGVGADGLILLQTSTLSQFRMRIFNSDGMEADFCGNGLRCLVLYLRNLGFREEILQIETQQAIISCCTRGEEIYVKLPSPKVLHWGIQIGVEVPFEMYVVDTGVPHAVIFVEDLNDVQVKQIGSQIRFHPYFAPEGVNVNFVKIAVDGTVHIRTYERGVEDETLSCGTGSAAAALVAFQKGFVSNQVRVMTKSKESLEFTLSESSEGKQIEMQGKASFVFEGRMQVPSETSCD